ncbi:16373_t:CDS:2 [Cetraspora pellucida]|uniref:16373_t:CDS:1 n=1 Tax=Cetraspora pellucida TaxID=1433469 RepID=A0A9N9AJC3_9GLOM|nr:16373_t:CDS:2 [Cetraspora pellucida]
MGRIKKSLLIHRANAKKIRQQRRDKDNLPIVNNAYDLENDEVAETTMKITTKLYECSRELQITQFFDPITNINSNNETIEDQQSDSESNLLPLSQCGKHPSQSLLYDEDVSLKILNYLKATKFKIKEYERLMPKWIDINCEVCEEPHLLSAPKGEQLLRKKELGKGLHISKFLVETIGRLKDEEEEASLMMQLVKKAIEIFERSHPRCVGVWAFDNATSHTLMAPDALVATRINLKPDGMQPKMRDTI